jgi:hypothetical protein
MAKRRIVRASRRRKRPKRSRPQRTGREPVSPLSKVMARAVAGLANALNDVSRHSPMVLDGLESISRSAADNREGQLVKSALQDNLFDDLVALDRVLSRITDGGHDLAPLRAVPAAILRWATVHMQLEPMLVVGETREVPVGSLDRYELDETLSVPTGVLVKVRVLTPGWKWRGKVVAKPRIQTTN